MHALAAPLRAHCSPPRSAPRAPRALRALRVAMEPAPKRVRAAGTAAAAGDGGLRCGDEWGVKGLVLRDLWLSVPLSHSVNPSVAQAGDGETITVYAREVVSHANAAKRASLPALVFLQGGPGFESPRPTETGGWLERACEDHRVVLLDQRGTGRSTAVTAAQLQRDFGDDAVAQAAYVANFRADAIVADAEALRTALLGEGSKWSTLGQSYGGFCTCTYLSFAPQSLASSYITGGLPPVDSPANRATDIYSRLFANVRVQCDKFYERFPHHEATVARVVNHLVSKGGSVPLPSGGVLSVRGFQTLGMKLGSTPGFETLSFMLETAFEGDELSFAFLREFENFVPFCINPIYIMLHEPIYVSGPGMPSAWACQSVLDSDEETSRLHDAATRAAAGERVYLTGEMCFPFMLDEFAPLRALKPACEALARKADWPELYDEAQLARNEVPVAAAVYVEDLFVEHGLSMETARKIKGLRAFQTSQYMHNGVREDGKAVLGRLIDMASGNIPLF